MEDCVNVAIRVRPSLNILENSIAVKVVSDDPPVLYVTNKQSYSFDHIFSADASQEKIYNTMVQPLIKKVLQGYNCTVFAYGQTGTGKTYTIGCNSMRDSNAGFITRTCDEFFSYQEEYKNLDIFISFYEIYNEKVFDLLSEKKESVTVKGFRIDGLKQIPVVSSNQASDLLCLGSANRHTGETKQNRYSSRSHAIFTITCIAKNENHETEAKLNLVDLAGSESVRRTGTEGSQFLEGININKGLFYVGRVISALTTNMSHIPYRQSMITTILQDSLSKKNFITLVACISPDLQDAHETIQTLEFAQGTKKVRNKPEINNVILEYKRNNPALFERPLTNPSVKVGSTPLKRQNHSMESAITPNIVKKPKINHTWTPMSTIVEPQTQITPPTLAAMSIASCSAIMNAPTSFPPLSPIVRKCTEVLENTMMEKLKVLMKAYTYRPSPEKKPMTPQFSWQRLQSEVSQIVRNEMVQLTAQRPHACSSPLDGLHVSELGKLSKEAGVVKRLEFEDEESFIFKVPEKPPLKVTVNKLNDNTLTRRRSARLSKKISPPPPPPPAAGTARRKSQRLTRKGITGNRAASKIVPSTDPAVVKSTTDFKLSHYNNILNILNNGDEKELQTLSSIGAKTAAQIKLYRQMSGPFHKVEDVSKMQCWAANQYKRFLKANLLITEEN